MVNRRNDKNLSCRSLGKRFVLFKAISRQVFFNAHQYYNTCFKIFLMHILFKKFNIFLNTIYITALKLNCFVPINWWSCVIVYVNISSDFTCLHVHVYQVKEECVYYSGQKCDHVSKFCELELIFNKNTQMNTVFSVWVFTVKNVKWISRWSNIKLKTSTSIK